MVMFLDEYWEKLEKLRDLELKHFIENIKKRYIIKLMRTLTEELTRPKKIPKKISLLLRMSEETASRLEKLSKRFKRPKVDLIRKLIDLTYQQLKEGSNRRAT